MLFAGPRRPRAACGIRARPAVTVAGIGIRAYWLLLNAKERRCRIQFGGVRAYKVEFYKGNLRIIMQSFKQETSHA